MTLLTPIAMPMPTVDEIAWMGDSICSRVDPELWTSGQPHNQRVAARMCHHCDAEPVCRDWALERHEVYGTWGGMTAAERKRYLREMERGPVPPPSDAAKV